jgi:predicted RNA-binding protein YlqC (UPF0109 family)
MTDDRDTSAYRVLLKIAEAVVDFPESVSITIDRTEDYVALCVHVDPRDLGKVIGARGHVADAVRVVLAGVSKKVGKKYRLIVAE